MYFNYYITKHIFTLFSCHFLYIANSLWNIQSKDKETVYSADGHLRLRTVVWQ